MAAPWNPGSNPGHLCTKLWIFPFQGAGAKIGHLQMLMADQWLING